ncbi:cell division protein FtsQ/DivIB [Teredinibacter turnerae]|uniref:cell division protein FtsQ/DivIB n=1 Tax=Teredinibacter turnerae TaxID=2426 RepID=UPI0005F81102|nr:cell division protein FtsQ/DivIB [Teredinibacter turnerae]
MKDMKPGTRAQRVKADKNKSGSGRAKAAKAATRGASSKPRVRPSKEPRNWRALFLPLRFLVILAFFGVLIFGVNWSKGLHKIQTAVNRPVSSISVKGEFSHLTKDYLQQVVIKQMNGDFVDLDLRSMRAALEAEPWVQTANVRRIWPDRLEILIQEQKPIARWGREGFINAQGRLIDVEDNSALAGLPVFYGPRSKSNEIAQTYLATAEILSTSGFGLMGIQVDETLSWRIYLTDNVELIIGQYDVLEKLNNFLLVYQNNLEEKKDQLARVDMRYDHGMAVSWKPKPDVPQLQASR